jgi:hypothetical protein
VSTPVGGSWAAKAHISCRLVAWYTPLETDEDNAGVDRTTIAAWNDFATASNDKITFAGTLPAAQWDHLAFYYQEATTWNSANACTKCTATFQQTSITEVNVTVLDDDDTATITFGATPKSFAIDNIAEITPAVRKNTLRAYDGTLIKKDYVSDLLYESLTLTLTMGSLTAANVKHLLDWIKDSVRVSMVESLSGSEVYIDTYVGKFTETDYLHTRYKRTGYEFTVVFEIETETEE